MWQLAPVTPATAHFSSYIIIKTLFDSNVNFSFSTVINFLSNKVPNNHKKHKLLFWWCILWVLNQIVISHPPNTRLLRFLYWPFPCHLLKTFLTTKKIHQHPRNLPMTFLSESDFTWSAVMRQRHLVFTGGETELFIKSYSTTDALNWTDIIIQNLSDGIRGVTSRWN